MSLSTFRAAPLAILLLLAAVAPAAGQSQVVSRGGFGPTAEDLEARGGIHVDLNFGAAVALSGGTAAIGIPYTMEEPEYGPGPGRVGIYSKTEAGWIRTATLLPSNPSDIRFGRDVDVCRNLAVVAAENSTYVFQRRGAHWREIKRIGPPSPGSVLGPVVCDEDSFAQSVGSRNDEGQVVWGTVHMYERRRGDDFQLVAKLRASDPNDSIGRSLAMERDVLVAGSEPDAAYVFARHGGRWIERQKLQSPVPDGSSFGAAVAIRDRIIIAGAPGVDLPNEDPFVYSPEGDAFVFLPHRGTWFESQRLNPPPPSILSSGRFGEKVAMGRRLAAVCVPFTQTDNPRAVSTVIVFDRIGAEFTPVDRFTAGYEWESIRDIDMSGRRLILGVHESAYLYGPILGYAVIIEYEPSPD